MVSLVKYPNMCPSVQAWNLTQRVKMRIDTTIVIILCGILSSYALEAQTSANQTFKEKSTVF